MVRDSHNRHDACPEIGMRQTNIPGRISTHRMPAQKDAITVDGETSEGIPKSGQHGYVSARIVVISNLIQRRPVRSDDDVAMS